jgi:DNA-binding transcriptional ArsR family regulator
LLVRRSVLTLGVDDWARSRFVRSPLFETAQAIRVLIHPGHQVHQQAWLAAVDPDAARARLVVLGALNPRSGWVPDFLAPPPRDGDRGVHDDLADVAGYPLELVAADLRRSLDSRPTRQRRTMLEPLIEQPDVALARIVAELEWAWTTLIEPFWPPVHELISADIAYRSREITRAGLGRALDDLHAAVSWNEGAITVEPAFDDVVIDLAGRGLALLPSAFVWPNVIVIYEPPWSPTLVYPARGIGELWTAPPPPRPALAGVLGRTRALLLADLGQPSTTTTLAVRHQLSQAAVSTQLGRLRAAGLVTGRRLGKEVHYQRTALADHLIRANPAGAAKPTGR